MIKFLNFLFKNEDKRRQENTLLEVHKKSSAKIDAFVKLTKDQTETRRKTFESLFNFALEGSQWTNSEINDLDGDMDLTFNFSENYIDRYMARLFPRNPHTGVLEIGVKVYESDKGKKEKYEKEILDVYKNEDLVSLLLEQGINFLAGGASIFYYPRDPITKKSLLLSLDPKDCYLGWQGTRLVQFAYREYVGDNKYNIYYWDLAEFLFKDGKTEAVKQTKNDFDFIPVAWLPNKPIPHKHEGRSKLLSLYNLDRAYNFAATDYSRRVKGNTDPHMVLSSDSVSLTDIDRGRKKKTKVEQGGDLKYLELKEGGEIIEYLNLIEAKIKSKAGIIDSAGALKANVSGVSLSFQYSDMMDLIGFMRIIWDTGFRLFNQAILSYQFGLGEYKTDPIYHPFINIDNKQRIDEYAIMLDKKLISHRDAIDELRGVESPEEKLRDIIAEDKILNPEPAAMPGGDKKNQND